MEHLQSDIYAISRKATCKFKVHQSSLYSYTFKYVEEFTEVLHWEKSEEENHGIYRVTGAFTALPLTSVIGTVKNNLLNISVVDPLLSNLLLNKIKAL